MGIAPEDMKYCIAIEDSMSGLRSAVASGATTVGQTVHADRQFQRPAVRLDQGYEGIDAASLDAFVRQRVSQA